MASPLTCAVPWCAGHGSRVGSFRDDDCVGTGGGEAHQADSTLIVAPRRVGRDPRFPASRAVFRPTGGLPRAMRRDATATPSTASPSTLSLAASRCSKREASVRCPGTSWCSRGGFATLTVGWNGSSAKRRHHGRPATTRSRRFSAKFHPLWERRDLWFEGLLGLPRAGVAALLAEGQIPRLCRPRWGRRPPLARHHSRHVRLMAPSSATPTVPPVEAGSGLANEERSAST